MSKVRMVKAKENLEAPEGQTWTAGEKYELTENEKDFVLACNEGNVAYVNKVKEDVLKGFKG